MAGGEIERSQIRSISCSRIILEKFFKKNFRDDLSFLASPRDSFYEIAASPTAPRKDNVVLVFRWKIAASRLAPLLAMTMRGLFFM